VWLTLAMFFILPTWHIAVDPLFVHLNCIDLGLILSGVVTVF
jgi:hypothetical protein